MSEETLTRLIVTLTSEAELFEEFLSLLEEQKDALVSNDIQALNRVTSAQQEMVSKSVSLDATRRTLVTQLGQENEIEGDVTISRLLKVVSEQHAATLTSLRNTILDLHDRIEDSRNRNATLLNKSREIVTETLKLIHRLGNSQSEGSAYDRGSLSTGKASNSSVTHNRLSLALDKRA